LSRAPGGGSIGRLAAVGAGVGLLVGVLWLAIGSSVAPLQVTCDPAVPADVCAETADAGLRRGMPRVHPLITEAHVVPAPAFPDGYGHRATVSYTLLPGPTTDVRLFFDAGGHWGGIASTSDVELALWALVPMAILATLGAGAGAAVAGARRSP
jgi:hypothetical protein